MSYSEATKCVVSGYVPSEHHHAANPPIYLTSTFEFDTAEACADAFLGKNNQMIYSRLGNPTQQIVEKRIATLEHTEDCMVASSGMGAISSTLWTFLGQGKTMIASNRIYGCTYALMKHSFSRFGINVVFCDMVNNDAFERAVKECNNKVDIVYTETLQNPTNDLVDLEYLAKRTHELGGLFIVDNTFASPICCNPYDFGADLVIHSCTKYLLGGIYTAGCVCGSHKLISQIKSIGLKDCTGAVLSADICFAMYEMIETLDVRYRRMSENAKKVAEFLEKNEKVQSVICTGLDSYPYADRKKKYIKVANPLFTVYLKGSYVQCTEFMNALKLCLRAVSLGKTHTLLDHPASMTHSTYSAEERLKYGITDNMIRISIGIEDAEDIINDFKQALEFVKL